MNCSDCIELMPELVRPVLIEASRRDGAFKHVESCESCSHRFALEVEMQANLSAMRDEDRSLSAPEEIKRNLVAAFREQQAVSVENPRQINGSWRIALGAVAAVLLLLVGYVFLSWMRVERDNRAAFVTPTPVPTTSPEKSSGTQVAKLFGGSEQMRLSTDKPKKAKNRGRAEKPERAEKPAQVGSVSYELGEFKAFTPRVELATDFIPLIAARGLPPSDSGQVIRVSMPRSAMAYFGLPVPPEAPGQQVSADVLVADDGLARAIRFVR